MSTIGIMQGRLLPKYKGRYQAHPVNYWQAEFYIARDLGFNQIEFILDFNDVELNPLLNKSGIKEIMNIIKDTGIEVKSICADYFMEAPLHSSHKEKSLKVLKNLILNAKELNIIDIVIPCVDQSSLKSQKDMKSFVQAIKSVLPLAEELNININFETDLNPKNFKKLLENFNSKNIKVNYDIGNSSSLGYDPIEEFEAYGEYISDLHIKDRLLHGASVELGTGNDKFKTVFKLLKKYKFAGNIVMQAAKDEEYIKDLTLVKKQKKFITKYINKYL